MTLIHTALLLGAALVSAVSGVAKQSCEEFGRGVSFTPDEAVGVWYLMRLEKSMDPGDTQCVQFSSVTEEERKDLAGHIGKQVEVKWDKLSLKMQIPCVGPSNKTVDYYLECLDVPGSYRTLQIPRTKLQTADFERHPMRLKKFLDKYLAMMDCYHNFVFIMGKQPQEDHIEPQLRKILQDNTANDD